MISAQHFFDRQRNVLFPVGLQPVPKVPTSSRTTGSSGRSSYTLPSRSPLPLLPDAYKNVLDRAGQKLGRRSSVWEFPPKLGPSSALSSRGAPPKPQPGRPCHISVRRGAVVCRHGFSVMAHRCRSCQNFVKPPSLGYTTTTSAGNPTKPRAPLSTDTVSVIPALVEYEDNFDGLDTQTPAARLSAAIRRRLGRARV